MSLTNEKIFSDVKSLGAIFIPINWLICIIVSAILYFVAESDVFMGYLLGSITSFLTFGLLMKSTSSLLDSKTKVKSKAFTNNFVRVLLTAAVVCSTLYLDKFNFIATLAGVMVLKITLVIFVLVRYKFFKDKEDDKNDDDI